MSTIRTSRTGTSRAVPRRMPFNNSLDPTLMPAWQCFRCCCAIIFRHLNRIFANRRIFAQKNPPAIHILVETVSKSVRIKLKSPEDELSRSGPVLWVVTQFPHESSQISLKWGMSNARMIVLSITHQGLTKAQAAAKYGVTLRWVNILLARFSPGGFDAGPISLGYALASEGLSLPATSAIREGDR